ncbi:response regulator [Pseudoalteromonas sp. B137]
MHWNIPKKPLIAVIDDEKSIRHGLSSLLRAVGYEVILFESAEAFLDYPLIHDIQLNILDLKLTGISGFELFKVLKDMKVDIPTIFISGNVEQSMINELNQRGGLLFLQKPIDIDRLLREIESIF